MYDVSGKRAIITGGAQGFGRQFARRLLQKGCRVCITDIDEIKGQEAKKEFQEQFGIKDNSIHFVKFDVTDKDGWNRMWDEAEKVLEGKIDIFANNAGINPTFGWEMCLKVMSVAATRGVFTAMERMSKLKGGNGGRIINTASIAGILNIPVGDELTHVGYNISKHGLVALTRYFGALEPDVFKTEGVKCYALAPWLADTNLVRSHIEKAINEGKPVVHKNQEIRNLDDYRKIGMMRALTVEEVGEAFIQSIYKDKNAAVYAVLPDMPLIEYPNEQTGFLLAVILTAAKIGSRLGVEVFTPTHFYVIMAIALYLLCAFINFLLGMLFCS